MTARPILVMAEGITLAHVGRAITIAHQLHQLGYKAYFACDKRFLPLIEIGELNYIPIHSIASKDFLQRVTWGKPLFTKTELQHAIDEDLGIFKTINPACVIGDLRWSLAISARVACIPYIAISNAYWSKYTTHQQFILPSHPILKHVGFKAMQRLFSFVRPAIFASLNIPSNQLRKKYNFSSLGWDYRDLHEDADYIWFADTENLHPTQSLPSNYHYLGPVQWAPTVNPPSWWEQLRTDIPIIYLNLGSSGGADLLPMLLEVLANMPVQVIAATAGRKQLTSSSPNIFIHDYLPGDVCMERADLAITNGGSMTSYQAIESATPVLGIVSLIDQHLNMQALAREGMGELLCASFVTRAILINTIGRLLNTGAYSECALTCQANLKRYTTEHPLSSKLQEALKTLAL